MEGEKGTPRRCACGAQAKLRVRGPTRPIRMRLTRTGELTRTVELTRTGGGESRSGRDTRLAFR